MRTAGQKGNANCATLAVARKLVAYLMAVDREQRDFEPVRGIAGIARFTILRVSFPP
jgi:transposase